MLDELVTPPPEPVLVDVDPELVLVAVPLLVFDMLVADVVEHPAAWGSSAQIVCQSVEWKRSPEHAAIGSASTSDTNRRSDTRSDYITPGKSAQ